MERVSLYTLVLPLGDSHVIHLYIRSGIHLLAKTMEAMGLLPLEVLNGILKPDGPE